MTERTMNRRTFSRLTAAGTAGMLLPGCEAARTVRKPNVLFVFPNQRLAEMCSIYGGQNVVTPDIDRPAREGVLFTADHGEMLGSSGRVGKMVPYAESINIPLILCVPEQTAPGRGIDTLHTPMDHFLTLCGLAGLPAPVSVDGVQQKPMDGVSFLATFTDPNAPEVRNRQYFEVFSNRGVYDNGWYACTQHTLPWRQDYAPGNWENDRWELYNLNEDFSLADDLATKYPDKLVEMKSIFDEEAEKYHVYPLDDRGTARLVSPKPSPGGADPKRSRFTYYAGAGRLAETAAPNTKNKSHTITADIEMSSKKDEGVLVAEGGISAGFSLYVKKEKLVYDYNWFDEHYIVTAKKNLPVGKSTVKMDFVYDGGGAGKGGTAALYVNDEKVGEGRIEKTVPGRFGIDTFGVGEDTGAPVSTAYKPPFRFTGIIDKVDIDLK